MFRYSIESKTSKMEIFNATSVYYTIIQIFILIFLGRGEGGVLIFRLIAWGVLKICMDLGGGYKKTSR